MDRPPQAGQGEPPLQPHDAGAATFDHVVFGASDQGAGRAFFLEALAPLGVAAVSKGPLGVGLCRPDNKSCLCVRRVEEKATQLHLAFTAESRRQVEDAYRAALAAGTKTMGRLVRTQSTRHNIEAVCHEPEA